MKKFLPLPNIYKIIIGFVIIFVSYLGYFLLSQYKAVRSFTIEDDITILKKYVGVSISAWTKVTINKVFGERSLWSMYDIILEKSTKWVFKIWDRSSNIHFSKPIKILFSTDLPDGTKVKIKAKHVWESTFTESGLTKTIDAKCVGGIPSIWADLSTVHDNQVIIYTCSLSEFVIEPVFILSSETVGFDQPVNVVHHLANDSMLIAWWFGSYKWESTNGNGIIKLLSNGEVDTWFSVPPWTIANVNAIAVQNDGKVLAWWNKLVRLNPDWSIDDNFFTGQNGWYGYNNNGIESILILPDDRILVGWTFYGGIQLLNADGSHVSWSALDIFTVYWIFNDTGPRVMKQQADWKILIWWLIQGFRDINGNDYQGSNLIRLNADLTIDTWFSIDMSRNFWESAYDISVYDILVQSDGKIVITFGRFHMSPNTLVRLLPDWWLDQEFWLEWTDYKGGSIELNSNGEILSYWTDIRDISIDNNNNIVLVWQFTEFAWRAVNNIIRLDNNGIDDGTFSQNIGKQLNGPIYDIAKQSDGKLIIIWGFTTYEWESSNWIARLNTDLSLDTSFQSPFMWWLWPDSTIYIHGDDKIMVWSYFNITANHGEVRNVIRLLPDWQIDETFLPDPRLYDQFDSCSNLKFTFLPNNKVLVWHCYLSRLNPDWSLDTGFDINSVQAGESVYNSSSMWVQGDWKILILHQWMLTRLLPDGDIDPTFNRNNNTLPMHIIQTRVQKIYVLPNNKILVGWMFNQYWNSNLISLVRLEADGDIDPTFVGPGLLEDSSINDIVVDEQGYIHIWWILYTDPLSPTVWKTLLKLYPNGTIYYTPPMPDTDNWQVLSLFLQNNTWLLIWWNFNTYNWITVSENFIKVNDIDSPAIVTAPWIPTIKYPTSGSVLSTTWSIVIYGTWEINRDVDVTVGEILYETTTSSTWYWEITTTELWTGIYEISTILTNSLYDINSSSARATFSIQTAIPTPPSTWQVTPPPAPSQWGGGWGWGGGWAATSTPTTPTVPGINPSTPSITLPSAGFPDPTLPGATEIIKNWHTLLLDELNSDKEMQTAYQFAYENKMTRNTLENKQTLYAPLTREELAKIMSSYIKNVDKKVIPQNKACTLEKYQDYRSINRTYRLSVLEMCNLGLMWVKSDGTPIAIYNPKWIVTRAELSTILSRYLYGKKYNKDWEDRYINHMNALKTTWVIKTSTAPTKREIRWFMFIMLHRIHSYK